VRWAIYIVLGGVAAATIGPEIVIVLAACGLVELILRPKHGLAGAGAPRPFAAFAPFLALTGVGMGGLLALAWVAVKVGALSYGGGFVIVPLMQHDAVTTYHWMNGAQFLTAVALGQITPGPVVQTVAVVGYAAAGVGGALLAALVAFTPSFVFVIGGAPHFDRLRTSAGAQGFLTGAGAATIGAIAGSAIPLGLELGHVWQSAMLALAVIWLLVMRKGVVPALVGCGVLGVVAALAGAPVGH
jgi:chromate transporter